MRHALLIFVTLLLAACGGGNSTPTQPAATPALRVQLGNGTVSGVTVQNDGQVTVNGVKVTTGAKGDLLCVCQGGIGFVAGSSWGEILTSIDGKQWVMSQSPVYDGIYGMTYHDGVYVGVGTNGTIVRSTDGVRWERSDSPASEMWLYSVAWCKDRFVASGEDGTVLTSTDGVKWEWQALGPGQWIYGVVYGNGLFVAVADDAVWTSTDMITWYPTAHFGKTASVITFDGQQFVAGGENGYIWTSTDGVHWPSTTVALDWVYGITPDTVVGI